MLQNMPYVVRMSKDMSKCFILLFAYLVVELLGAFISAISLWYTGQLLCRVEAAMERRTVDTSVLAEVAVAHLACTITMRLLKYARRCIIFPMDTSIRRVDAERKFHSLLYLDVPTYNALTQIISSSRLGIQSEIVEISTHIAMTVVRLLSQLLVLMTVLREQQDGLLLAILSLSQPIFNWDGTRKAAARSSIWVATAINKDFLRTRALRQLVLNPQYREELVTGNISEYITAQFCESSRRVGNDAVPEVQRIRSIQGCLSVVSVLRETISS